MTKFISVLTTPSTMQTAKEMLQHIPKYTQDFVILAEHQTQGRGRQGRRWETHEGNLAMTLCTSLGFPPDPRIAFVAGLAVCQALQDLSIPDIQIKWPNDILIRQQKVAGILIEGFKDYLLIGIGVNILTHPEKENATHIMAFMEDTQNSSAHTKLTSPKSSDTPHRITKDFLAHSIVYHFNILKERFVREGFEPIRDLWIKNAAFLGEKIHTHHPKTGVIISGLFTDIDLQGAIVLQCLPNDIFKIHAGDIFSAQ